VKLAPAVEEDLLSSFIERALALPADQRVAAVDQRAKERKGAPAEIARAVAKELITGAKVGDRENRAKFFGMTASEFLNSGDPLIVFMADLYRQQRPLLDEVERDITAPLEAATRAYAQALMEFKGAGMYPDANGTLRFSYGQVRGYQPAPRGSRRPYATTVGTLLATASDAPDYRLREEVRAQLDWTIPLGLDDTNLGTMAVNFIADADIVGGNSGSPALDGMGEVIGCVFDGNYEGLDERYAFDPAQDRTIMVDIRFIVALMVRIYGATDLAQELGFEP
jgi:hypothetical protein